MAAVLEWEFLKVDVRDDRDGEDSAALMEADGWTTVSVFDPTRGDVDGGVAVFKRPSSGARARNTRGRRQPGEARAFGRESDVDRPRGKARLADLEVDNWYDW